MSNRKSLSKKKRFEVFKRDSFTCQYCGGEAPDVILEIDHIDPVSKGGGNDITNLITSCKPCNSGKSNRELSDNSVVKKRKKQLDEIQERKNQLEMIAEWQKSLIDLQAQKCEIVNDIYRQRTEWSLKNPVETKLNKLIKDFGLNAVCEAVNISIDQYYDGTENSWNKAFKKIGGICYYRDKGEDEALKQAYYIKGIFDNRRIRYRFPIVRFTKEAIDDLGYDYVHKAATTCTDSDEYIEFIQNGRDNG